jgi:lipopolysaccharide transport system permease protein
MNVGSGMIAAGFTCAATREVRSPKIRKRKEIQRFPAMLIGPFLPFVEQRSLLFELTKREVLGRYRGASFGLFWALLSPFLMLCVYTVAFGFVMKSKWPHAVEGRANFALILYVGLIIHGFFAECVARSPRLIVDNSNFVKRVIFPLDVLPWAMILSAFFHALMSMLVFVVLYVITSGSPPWTVVFFPLVLLPFVFVVNGLAWFLASLGVYLRDINQVTGVLITALLFLSSAIMPLDSVPERYQAIFQLNPLTFIIDQAREVALWGGLPDWVGLTWYTLKATVFMYLGHAWFRFTRSGFADVL